MSATPPGQIPPPGWIPHEIGMSAKTAASRESAAINKLRHLDFLNTVNNSRELLGKPKYIDGQSTEVYVPPSGWTAEKGLNDSYWEGKMVRWQEVANVDVNVHNTAILDKPDNIDEELLTDLLNVKVSDRDIASIPEPEFMDPWTTDLNDKEAPEDDPSPSLLTCASLCLVGELI